MDLRRRDLGLVLCGLTQLGLLLLPGSAQAGLIPVYTGAVYYGGAGNETGSGITAGAGNIYVAGQVPTWNVDGLVAQYSVPPLAAPTWTAPWPNGAGPNGSRGDFFSGVAVTSEGVYASGAGESYANDGVGGLELKGYLVKFPLTGPTGPGVGGCTWYRSPNFFAYRGGENLNSVLAVEAGPIEIYAAGYAQAGGANNTAVLTRYDTNGNLVWRRDLGSTGSFNGSAVTALASLGGYIYAAGGTQYPYTDPNALRAVLWKYDAAGNPVWTRDWPGIIAGASDVAASAGYIYVVGSRGSGGPFGGVDAFVVKYDEAGNLVWSREWGGAADDYAYGVAVRDDTLFVVGETSSFGAGGKDAFILAMLAADGTTLSVQYWGGPQDDLARDVVALNSDLYVVGQTASFGGGGTDLVLLKYALVPEPGSLALLACGLGSLLGTRRRRRR